MFLVCTLPSESEMGGSHLRDTHLAASLTKSSITGSNVSGKLDCTVQIMNFLIQGSTGNLQ